jgi:aspartyl-tRNA(Asn)/glutamyl-tRNA(Gln) amidotransferase subunit C
MAVDKETTRRIAKLARIAIEEDRLASMMAELNGILAWIEQLKEVKIDRIPPMTGVVAQKLKMREDKITDGGYPDDLMKNAPMSEDHYFVVPKVVE